MQSLQEKSPLTLRYNRHDSSRHTGHCFPIHLLQLCTTRKRITHESRISRTILSRLTGVTGFGIRGIPAGINPFFNTISL